MRGLSVFCFETGLWKPMLILNDPNVFKNTKNVYSIHLELRMALPCQITTGKWKYVNPCLDFLGIPDQRTAYVKRQVRPDGRTYVDQVSPPSWQYSPPITHSYTAKLIIGLRPANERGRYTVTPSLIGWVQINDLSMMYRALCDRRHEGATRISQCTRRVVAPRALTYPSGPWVPPISQCTIHHV